MFKAVASILRQDEALVLLSPRPRNTIGAGAVGQGGRFVISATDSVMLIAIFHLKFRRKTPRRPTFFPGLNRGLAPTALQNPRFCFAGNRDRAWGNRARKFKFRPYRAKILEFQPRKKNQIPPALVIPKSLPNFPQSAVGAPCW